MRLLPLACLCSAGCSIILATDEPPATGQLELDTDLVSFGALAGTTSAPYVITGVADADTQALEVIVTGGEGFDAGGDCTGRPLIAGQACEVVVEFSPTAPGPAAAELRVGGAAVALEGMGHPPGELVAMPATLSFGLQVEAQTMVVTLSTMSVLPADDVAIRAEPPFLPSECDPTATPCVVLVEFDPTVGVDQLSALQIDAMGAQGPVMTHVSVSGRALPEQSALTVSVVGDGQVISAPTAIVCAADAPCIEMFPGGQMVTLSPQTDVGFLSWQGDCSGSGACVIEMNRPRAVRALFESLSL